MPWKPPYRVDVTQAVKPGQNRLRVRVADPSGLNRLIGDAQPGAQKITYTSMPTYLPNAPLRPAGLNGSGAASCPAERRALGVTGHSRAGPPTLGVGANAAVRTIGFSRPPAEAPRLSRCGVSHSGSGTRAPRVAPIPTHADGGRDELAGAWAQAVAAVGGED